MYFTSDEIQPILESYGISLREGELEDRLQEIEAALLARPGFYRQFGVYWWTMKRSLKARHAGEARTSRPWFCRSFFDPAMEHAASTAASALAYAAVQTAFSRYPIAGEADEHLWEDGSGEAHFYRLRDTDFPLQPGLFDDLASVPAADERAGQRQGTLDLDGDVCVYIPGTWQSLGNRSLNDGRYHEAAACFRKFAALGRTDGERSEGWLYTGLAYEEAGHYAKAVACYRRSHRVGGQPWVLENIASACEKMGDLVGARRAYEAALQDMPANPVLKQSLRLVRERLGEAQ